MQSWSQDPGVGFAVSDLGDWPLANAAVFAHELGHVMGLSHDRYAEGRHLSNDPYPYSYGYVNQRMFEPGASASTRWWTIMAYATQCFDWAAANGHDDDGDGYAEWCYAGSRSVRCCGFRIHA